MSPPSTAPNPLESLAQDVSGALGIAFRATSTGVAFAQPLPLVEWSVPLIFDGHLAHRGGSLVPVDFVGHVVWAGLCRVADGDDRSWWSCELSAFAAQTIVDDYLGVDEIVVVDEELDDCPDWSGGHASGM